MKDAPSRPLGTSEILREHVERALKSKDYIPIHTYMERFDVSKCINEPVGGFSALQFVIDSNEESVDLAELLMAYGASTADLDKEFLTNKTLEAVISDYDGKSEEGRCALREEWRERFSDELAIEAKLKALKGYAREEKESEREVRGASGRLLGGLDVLYMHIDNNKPNLAAAYMWGRDFEGEGLDRPMPSGLTPLQWAAYGGHADLVKEILGCGVNLADLDTACVAPDVANLISAAERKQNGPGVGAGPRW
jgi:hypothetical protein